jgi:L-rhamnose isomerase
MALADTFQRIVDSLPDDWTDLELDMRIADESRYVEAALYLTTCNARPYSKHDWHWRLLVAHRFGHAASAQTVHGALALLDDAAIDAELVVRETRSGRAEITHGWGRPQSAREEFRRLRAQ